MEEQQKRSAAYISWQTFKNSLDRLRDAGMPNRIDKSVFVGLSGGTQIQLVAAMKFLGLIDEQGDPSPGFRELVEKDELERKEPLRRVFEAAYPKLFDLDLTKCSPDQLNEAMTAEYGVRGSTRQKAVRFFLTGAEDLGIAVSPFLVKAGKATVRSNGASRRTRKKKATAKQQSTAKVGGTSRTVPLASGGELTLSATADFFSLSAEDRRFVFELIDKLDGYEQANTTEEEPVAPVQESDLEEQEVQ